MGRDSFFASQATSGPMNPKSSANTEADPLLGYTQNAPAARSAVLMRTSRRRAERLTIAIGTILFIFAYTVLHRASSYKVKPVSPRIQLPGSIKHSWAQYTPYYSSKEYTSPPKECKITQVNILQRHGARFPASNENEGNEIKAALANLRLASEFLDPRLEFLRDYEYKLGEDDMVAFGAAQRVEQVYDYSRYQDLVGKFNIPFVRASGDQRVIDSATNWTAGFSYAGKAKAAPSLNVIIEESPESNNTLNDGMCPNAGNADNQTNEWNGIYATAIAARLNSSATGARVTVADVMGLFTLCALETVALVQPSPFCGLFDQTEFERFEYYGDLKKYYGIGYGQELGPVQGVGYINELIARLTETPVRDNTQTNRTLDSDPSTFPLNRTVYADFSHENVMIAIYSALGLFRQPKDLDPKKLDPSRTWIASRLVPFSARLVTERLNCSETTSVRILVNDRLQPLEFCGADEDGICTLDTFLESQMYARNDGNGDFAGCHI